MRFRIGYALCIACALIVAGSSSVLAQTKHLAWEQPAPSGATAFTSADASNYVYRLYIQPTTSGVQVPGVSCTTTNAPLVKTCSAPLPSNVKPGNTIVLTTSESDGSNESGPSNSATFTVPQTPTSFRIALARFLHSSVRAFRAR